MKELKQGLKIASIFSGIGILFFETKHLLNYELSADEKILDIAVKIGGFPIILVYALWGSFTYFQQRNKNSDQI